MPRSKKPTLDSIDVSRLPFQSRTTLGQYMLKRLEQRKKGANDVSKHFMAQLTLVMQELDYHNRIIV